MVVAHISQNEELWRQVEHLKKEMKTQKGKKAAHFTDGDAGENVGEDED